MIDKLLHELDILWNASADSRFKGEHPGCDRIQSRISEEFKNMKDSEVIEILDGLSKGQLEQIAFVLECMEDTRGFVSGYL